MLFLPVMALGVWAIATGWPSTNWFVQGLWTFVTGYCILCAGSCYHEAVHYTLFGSRRWSQVIGHGLGTMLLIPFHVYREVHIRHHAYMNSPADWEMWPYSDPKASLGFRRVFVWFDFVFGSLASLWIYNRIYFKRNSPIKSPELRRAIVWEFAVCVAAWGALIGVTAWYGAWSTLLFAWLLPMGVAGSLQSCRKLTEHLGMASYDPLIGTRTVICRDWPSRVCTFFNFDIFVHGVHHRHPRLSHDELKSTMQDYADQDPEVGTHLYPYYILAMFDVLPWMLKNPGTGMNVGAPPPPFKDNAEVQTFLTDVSVEVLGQPAERNKSQRIMMRDAVQLSEREHELLGPTSLRYFEHYASFATARTELFFVKVYRGDKLLGVAPVIKSIRFNALHALRPAARRWLSLLMGPLAKATTYSVDNGLSAFHYRSPFYCTDEAHLPVVRQAVSDHLKSKQDGDSVFIGEPLADAAWTIEEGYDPFLVLPMAHIDVAGCATLDDYLAKISKKRRKNIRQAQRDFAQGGAVIETHDGELAEDLQQAMVHCLRESARRTNLEVPWGDVGNNEQAFRSFPQIALVARTKDRLVAFMTFIVCGDELLQIHGGLDYGVSLEVKAYHNLMTVAAEYAISRGLKRVSFGPLNNETKRRGADELLPMAGSIWTRNPLLRPFSRNVLIPNFQVYTGKLGDAAVALDVGEPRETQDPAEVGSHTS
jgi:fatty acid desaturase